MDLNELHHQLSKDPTYRRAYAELGGVVELALHCRAVREEQGLTQAELASQCGVTASAISRFERFDGAEDSVIAAIVRKLQPGLRRRAVPVEHWLDISPVPSDLGSHRKHQEAIPVTDRRHVPKLGRSETSVPSDVDKLSA